MTLADEEHEEAGSSHDDGCEVENPAPAHFEISDTYLRRI